MCHTPGEYPTALTSSVYCPGSRASSNRPVVSAATVSCVSTTTRAAGMESRVALATTCPWSTPRRLCWARTIAGAARHAARRSHGAARRAGGRGRVCSAISGCSYSTALKPARKERRGLWSIALKPARKERGALERGGSLAILRPCRTGVHYMHSRPFPGSPGTFLTSGAVTPVPQALNVRTVAARECVRPEPLLFWGVSMRHATLRTPGLLVVTAALLVGAVGWLHAQGAVVTGKVSGRQGEALGGALVVIDELNLAVATTTTGTYTLTVPPERAKGQTVTLRGRYIGYSPATRQITLTPGTQTQNLELKFDPMTLDAVVVTGVAEATEVKKLTFAVGHVDASQLQQAPAVTALGSLEGKVAGARLINSSGAPGGEPTIRLRSATALTSPSACSSQPCPATEAPGPLIIVDGTITRHGLADINSEDIERVEVVKGAAASSLYGSDAANGVVQVFTKRGERVPDGKLVVQVRNEYGQSFRPKVIPTALASPYVLDTVGPYTDANGSTVNNGDFISKNGACVALNVATCLVGPTGLPAVKADGIADVPYNAYGKSVYDAQSQLLSHGAFYTNYISIGQRRGNTNFNVSFQNTKQDGVLILLKGYDRQNFRVNVGQALTPRLDLSVGGFFGKSNNNNGAQGP